MAANVKIFIIKPNMDGWIGFNNHVKNIHSTGKVVTVEVMEGEKKKRSLSANALQAVWMDNVCEHFGNTEEEIRCDLKIRFGIPIILGAGDYRSEMLLDFLEKHFYKNLSFEAKCELIKDLPVTRIMEKKEHKRFMDSVQMFFAEHGLQLVVR